MAVLDPGNFLPKIDWQTRKVFLKLGAQLQKQGLDLRVRSGLRSCAEQDAIYAQGRTTPGDIVTDAPGCDSWHVMGRAIDADPILRSTGQMASISSGAYTLAGQIWESLGGVWGGRFTGLQDWGHFEYHPGTTISTVCPNAALCRQSVMQIATVEPPSLLTNPWAYAIGSFFVVGAILWVEHKAKHA